MQAGRQAADANKGTNRRPALSQPKQSPPTNPTQLHTQVREKEGSRTQMLLASSHRCSARFLSDNQEIAKAHRRAFAASRMSQSTAQVPEEVLTAETEHELSHVCLVAWGVDGNTYTCNIKCSAAQAAGG